MATDPVQLTADLIRCPSVTPVEGGALELIAARLGAAGFACTRIDRNGTPNLFARWGRKGHPRTFGFNGHTDVVPPGELSDWSHPPFAAATAEGFLWGRGAVDMKSGVAAFVAAAIDFVAANPADAAVIVTVTGDEEGDAGDGTVAILDWMEANGEAMSVCIVGEPTSTTEFGDTVKIGRRGSMDARFVARGVQGHSAYPHRSRNAAAATAVLMARLAGHRLDEGTEHFDASTLSVATIDTGNTATNVVPASCRAAVNIRFNDAHSSGSLAAWLAAEADRVTAETGVTFEMTTRIAGESFLTPPGHLSDLVAGAIARETNRATHLSTTGGTSDARFIRAHCPVVEFGLVGKTLHAVDERVEIEQIGRLKAVYGRILSDYFG